MKNIRIIILTSTNYFEWKSHMEDILRSKGIYRITLGIETAPIDDEENIGQWERKNDQDHGLIRMSISLDLIFHLYGLYSPIEAWEKLNNVLGLKN